MTLLILERASFVTTTVMYKCWLVIISLILSFSAVAQKDISRRFDAGNIQRLEIYTDEVFRINLISVESDEIIISTHSEGEYFNDISLEVEQLQNKMILTSNFSENLQGGYDKLSAHKVFSFEIDLTVPEGMEIYIRSNLASLNAAGKFKDLQVELQSGVCKLSNFQGNATVNTYRGGIWVETNKAVITASSGTGNVEIPEGLNGTHQLELRSINGDIKVVKN